MVKQWFCYVGLGSDDVKIGSTLDHIIPGIICCKIPCGSRTHFQVIGRAIPPEVASPDFRTQSDEFLELPGSFVIMIIIVIVSSWV